MNTKKEYSGNAYFKDKKVEVKQKKEKMAMQRKRQKVLTEGLAGNKNCVVFCTSGTKYFARNFYCIIFGI